MDLLQKLFPEAFAPPSKPERQNNAAPKTPALIKAAISSSSFNVTPNSEENAREINYRRVSVTPVPAAAVSDAAFINKSDHYRRKSMSTGSEKQMHSDFDKYLERKKLTKPSKLTAASPKNYKTPIPKTEKTTKAPKRARKSSTKTLPLIGNNDPKLGNQMKPIVVLNRVEGSVFILRSGMTNETFTEISPGVYKLKKSPPHTPPPPSAPPLMTIARQIPAIRTKSLSDILSDVVVQEMTAAAPKGKENSQDGSITSDAILAAEVNVEKQKQLDLGPLRSAIEVTVTVLAEKFPLEEKEKEKEEDGKVEESVSPEIVPLSNDTSVKSQDEMELKQIKKEEMETKSPSPDAAAHVIPSKPVSADCFKKPLKSMTQKRSLLQATTKSVLHASNSSPSYPVRKVKARSSAEASNNRQEIQEPVTSTNNHLFPPLTSESESDSSCRTEQTGDIESSELSDSSQSLHSPQKTLKVRLRRYQIVQKQLETNSTVSNSIMEEMKAKAAAGARKRRAKKSVEMKGEVIKKIFENADSSTAPLPMNLDQQPPQSGLINGVLVPNIEAMNTPPPTPPTTVDDKSSVADDTSQEAKSQTATEAASNIDPSSHPPVIYENHSEHEHDTENNINDRSSNIIPPIEIRENGENLQAQANQVLNFRSPPGQRRRFESVSLPSTNNKKRPHKISTAEVSDSDDIPAKDTSRNHLKKRRKTICTDVFNPPNYSSDEETRSTKAAADSPSLDVLRMCMFAWGSKSPMALSKDRQDETSAIGLENGVTSNLCDSSRLSPTFADAPNPKACSTQTAGIVETAKMEIDGSPCSSRPNCDSPVATSRKLAVSRTYSKSNMVQQVFVPPEIEMFIDEPTKFGVRKPTHHNLVSTTTTTTTSASTNNVELRSSFKTKASRKKYTTSDEGEQEDDDIRDKDYQEKPKATRKQSKRGRKKGASRRRRQ